jgi:Ser/Thr protein kinase RdoA (MazF antagonist)
VKVDPKILTKAAEIFDLHVGDLRPLGGQEGMALEFKRDDQTYILKITPKHKGTPAEVSKLEGKLDFIRYLAENGAQVAGPVPTPQGKWVESIQTESTLYLVNALTKADGKHLNLHDPRTGTATFFHDWGKTMGKMHALAKTYKSWQKNLETEAGSLSPVVDDWLDEHETFAEWCQFDDVRRKWFELGERIAKFQNIGV